MSEADFDQDFARMENQLPGEGDPPNPNPPGEAPDGDGPPQGPPAPPAGGGDDPDPGPPAEEAAGGGDPPAEGLPNPGEPNPDNDPPPRPEQAPNGDPAPGPGVEDDPQQENENDEDDVDNDADDDDVHEGGGDDGPNNGGPPPPGPGDPPPQANAGNFGNQNGGAPRAPPDGDIPHPRRAQANQGRGQQRRQPPPNPGRPNHQRGANINGRVPAGGGTGHTGNTDGMKKLLNMSKEVENPDSYQQVQMLADTVAITLGNLSKLVNDPVPDRAAIVNTFKALEPVVGQVQKEATASHQRAQNHFRKKCMEALPKQCEETIPLPLAHKTNIPPFGKDDKIRSSARCREFIRQIFNSAPGLTHEQYQQMFLRHTTGRANAMLYDLSRDGADLEEFVCALESDYAQLCTAEEAHMKLSTISFNPAKQNIQELAQDIRGFAQMATRHDHKDVKLDNEKALAKQTLTRCLPTRLRLEVEKEQRRLSSLGRPPWSYSTFTQQVENIRQQLEMEKTETRVQRLKEKQHYLEDNVSSVNSVRAQAGGNQSVLSITSAAEAMAAQEYMDRMNQVAEQERVNPSPPPMPAANVGPRYYPLGKAPFPPRSPSVGARQGTKVYNPAGNQQGFRQNQPRNLSNNRAPGDRRFQGSSPSPNRQGGRGRANYPGNNNRGPGPRGDPQRPASAILPQSEYIPLRLLNVQPGECMRCGLEGHRAFGEGSDQCPLAGKPLTTACPACTKGGHFAADCPRKPYSKN